MPLHLSASWGTILHLSLTGPEPPRILSPHWWSIPLSWLTGLHFEWSLVRLTIIQTWLAHDIWIPLSLQLELHLFMLLVGFPVILVLLPCFLLSPWMWMIVCHLLDLMGMFTWKIVAFVRLAWWSKDNIIFKVRRGTTTIVMMHRHLWIVVGSLGRTVWLSFVVAALRVRMWRRAVTQLSTVVLWRHVVLLDLILSQLDVSQTCYGLIN